MRPGGCPWLVVGIACLCAAFSAWAGYLSPDHWPWVALAIGFLGYAIALAYRGEE